MSKSEIQETIVAQATAGGEAAIAMIRLSGPLASPVARNVFGQKRLRRRSACRGDYRDSAGEPVDDVLYTFFPEPRSYTGEDVLEICCHGNPYIVRKILDDLLSRGCRLAEPGEFTRRAFLNGRMDLSQAEAVSDIIRARSDRALEVARHQLRGALGHRVERMVDDLLQVIAELEAYIDFPEEDLPAEDPAGPAGKIERLASDIVDLARTSRYGALLREGVRTVILGAPNAGKSSLLNRLVGHERVLVTDQPGTTRDAVEEALLIGGFRIRILDTAGIRATPDRLELLSIEKTLQQVEQADFFIVILDATLPHPEFPREILDRIEAKNTLVVQNKMDLVKEPEDVVSWSGLPEVRISALTGDGFPEMEKRFAELIEAFCPAGNSEDFVAVGARHADALGEAARELDEGLALLRAGEPGELVASSLRAALHSLGKITGKVDNEAMLDKLFASFCIGK